jgi:hypothetical protein
VNEKFVKGSVIPKFHRVKEKFMKGSVIAEISSCEREVRERSSLIAEGSVKA